MLILFSLKSKINVICLTFAKELRLLIRQIDIRVQKIDSTILDNYEMVVAVFLVTNKANRVKFFEETFLVANISPKIVFRMLFLTLSGPDVNFLDQKLWWKIYTTKEAFPTTKHIELVRKKEFVAAALDLEYKTFIVYITSFNSSITSLNSNPLNADIYTSCKPQIAGLIAKKVLMKVSAKYSNFANVFFPDLTPKFFKHTKIIDYAIELVDN